MAERTRGKRKGGHEQVANAKKRVAQTEREAQALALRIGGANYSQIATALGCSKAAAWNTVESALRKTIQEPADHVRTLELARLDRWLLTINTQIQAGSLDALDRGLKIMTRRATLLGLDAPTKVAPTTPAGDATYQPTTTMPDEDYFRKVAAIFQELGPLHLQGLSDGGDAATAQQTGSDCPAATE